MSGAATDSQIFLIGCTPSEKYGMTGPEPTPMLMGFKAYNLLRMAEIGLPVPPAFVLGTGYCALYHNASTTSDVDLRHEWQEALHRLEAATGLGFGNNRKPLFLSVRSGAPVSMPGMMETLLNVGLTDMTLPGLIARTGNPRLAWDAYRRLVATFGEVVADVPVALFEEELGRITDGHDERELDFFQLREVTRCFLAIYLSASGTPFPQDPYEQLQRAIDAVFRSWQSARAQEYRRVNRIDDRIGTAVTVQAMVFGNAGGTSGAGVGFSRDPVEGEPVPWVDFLFNAQGEDIVSGRRSAHGYDALSNVLPGVWNELTASARKMERAFGDMQDFEFTVQEGCLYLLQSRTGKRSARAAAHIACDLFDEKIIDREEANKRTASLNEDALSLQRVIAADGKPLQAAASASSASGGVASGEIALDETRARTQHEAGIAVILVRRDADTADVGALACAAGLLTERGARTSHAAVVARQMGKVCLVGCQALHIDELAHRITLGGLSLNEGDIVTLDGNQGLIYAGATKIAVDRPVGLLARLAALRA